ncbi:sensor histidine kinase [Nocardioides sp. SR21]|uniref:sensor histidine kinase n=1 Tax=Nocardioides sp. SR21 TaxID=2919501 RepID=UPI001FA9BD2C|nr:histidine kinase [Nocardioides sp. SR21]
MERPDPAEYQPPLRWWSHAWRFVAMLSISTVVWLTVVDWQTDARFVLDIALGVPTFVLVFFRRRWPVTIAVVLTLASGFSSIAAGPATLAGVSLATRRRWREIVPIAVLSLVCAQLFTVVHPSNPTDPDWLIFVTNLGAVSATLAWGMYIGSRRELFWTLRNRAERAEAEQELMVRQARSQEQARIAREMHDVLAHRISQISMHAGALAYRTDLTPEEVHTSAEVIRDKAHEALNDLRGVLGVLRDGATGEPMLAPQPTYADLPGLVADAQASGMRIEFEDLVEGTVPDAAGRTVYRIVQEGITNARKHAPGALLSVQVSGTPDDGIDVSLRNPVGFGPTRTPGAGLGLVGLTERAQLRGGRLDHGREGSSFVLHGWIPWAA